MVWIRWIIIIAQKTFGRTLYRTPVIQKVVISAENGDRDIFDPKPLHSVFIFRGRQIISPRDPGTLQRTGSAKLELQMHFGIRLCCGRRGFIKRLRRQADTKRLSERAPYRVYLGCIRFQVKIVGLNMIGRQLKLFLINHILYFIAYCFP